MPGQTVHPLWTAWATPAKGFATNRFKWGINHRPNEPVAPYDDWTSDTPGLYWVNPTHPLATADNSKEGWPNRPRKYFPTQAPAGSIIYAGGDLDWLETDYVNATGSVFKVGGNGTFDAPIYVRGDINGRKKRLGFSLQPIGTYVVIQGFTLEPVGGDKIGSQISGAVPDPFSTPPNQFKVTDHVVIRECLFTKELPNDHEFGATPALTVLGTQEDRANNAVIYKCTVDKWGAWQSTTNRDRHGFSVNRFADTVAFMKCKISACEGDAIQINAGAGGGVVPADIDGVMVFQNEASETQQSAFWTKTAKNVTILQNTATNVKGEIDSDPYKAGFGCQYEQINLKFIRNTAQHCDAGIMLDGGTITGELLIEENVLIDIEETTPYPPGGPPPGDTGYNGWANRYNHTGSSPIIRYNTMIQTMGGICQHGGVGQPATIRNNLFSDTLTEPEIFCHIKFQNGANRSASDIADNSVSPAGSPLLICCTGGCP